MTLDQILTMVRENLPVAVGGTVAVLVLSFLAVQQARRRRVIDPATLVPSSPAPAPAGVQAAAAWAPPEQSYADRRGAIRREGSPVHVLLSSSSLRNGVNDGYVVDRSTGGLRIVMQAAYPAWQHVAGEGARNAPGHGSGS